MRLLFVGESWQGSNARSMCEALGRIEGVELQEIAEDRYLPQPHDLGLRVVNRLLRPLQMRDIEEAVFAQCRVYRPDALVVYKGWSLGAALVRRVRALGVATMNIYPDRNPHAHGTRHGEAVGAYDLVASSKHFHPPLWTSHYGYSNACVHVPHGYDPRLHLWTSPSERTEHDVVLCANWRDEYDRLMQAFARASDSTLRVAIAGAGWRQRAHRYPVRWRLLDARVGRAYGEFLRSGRIVIAPVNTELTIDGVGQPGDEDTARTYEIPAAYCFFAHQRSPFVLGLFDEQTEVPMWRDAAELATLVRHWLADTTARASMAARAHARAVPAYSMDARAESILQHVRTLVAGKNQHD